MSSQSILDICSEDNIQIDPITLRRIFLILIRNHYAEPINNFGGIPDSFKTFKYSDDPKERTLDIQLDYNYDSKKLDQKPCIYLGFGNFDFSKQVINNYMGNNEDHSNTEFCNATKVNCTIKHISAKADEALMLGVISAAFFRGIATTIRETLRLRGFEVVQLTQPRVSDASTDTQFTVDLHMTLLYSSNWQTYSESHRIKKINYNLESI